MRGVDDQKDFELIFMRKIIKNSILCKLCGDIIESTYRHQYVECKCGTCAVDGGHYYLRRSFKEKDHYIDLSVTEKICDTEKRLKRLNYQPIFIDSFNSPWTFPYFCDIVCTTTKKEV